MHTIEQVIGKQQWILREQEDSESVLGVSIDITNADTGLLHSMGIPGYGITETLCTFLNGSLVICYEDDLWIGISMYDTSKDIPDYPFSADEIDPTVLTTLRTGIQSLCQI